MSTEENCKHGNGADCIFCENERQTDRIVAAIEKLGASYVYAYGIRQLEKKTKSENKIKDCPFCGASVPTVLLPRLYQDTFYLECQGCGCKGPFGASEMGAVKIWNRRKP